MGDLIAFKHWRGDLRQGDVVEVTCTRPCNVQLMSDPNFRRYKKGDRFRYIGGGFLKLPAKIIVPSDDFWNVVVDIDSLDRDFEFSVKVRKARKFDPRLGEGDL